MTGGRAEVEQSALDALAARWIGAWTGDLAAGFGGSCTPDVSYEDPVAVEPLQGLDALEAHAALVRTAFPDMRVELTSPSLHRDPFACVPWRLLGTHRGDLPELPATDRFVILHGLHYLELRDGSARRARGFFDLYDLGAQLGMLPARGGLGETALLLLRGFGLRRRG